MVAMLSEMEFIQAYEAVYEKLPVPEEIEEVCGTRPHVARRYIKQYQVYKFIGTYKKENAYSPSYRDIAEHLSISKTTISNLIYRLLIEGYVDYMPDIARTLRVIEHPTLSLEG